MSSLTLWAWLVLTAAPSPQPFAVSGTVVDPEGKPVKGATVWLTAFVRFDADVEELAQVETDAEGRFAIDAPVGGGDRPRSLSTSGPTRRGTGSLLPRHPTARTTTGDRSAWLSGRRRGRPCGSWARDGKPVAGANVRLSPLVWPAGLRARLEATTDARGRAAIEGVDPATGLPRRRHGRGARHPGAQRRAGRGGEDRAAPARRPGRGADRVRQPEGPAPAGWSSPRPFPTRRANLRRATNSARGRTDEVGPGRARSARGRAGRHPRRAARGLAVLARRQDAGPGDAPRRRDASRSRSR